ncbi:GNAT family N-acetyltransferase [Pelagibacterium montanilacus]|uniref:GNAT family N-acetyltransferase n=1 Tax=Pelagibacterium montanilacus TaxID=2185280 RepID=UPI000F8F1B63|nr:GNAT family N-acetyltransferase [Pelagibacterium montanilacus]
MSDALTIRPASIAEADRLGHLAYFAWESSMDHVLAGQSDAGPVAEREALLLSFQLFCINASADIVVADEGGMPIGWAARDAMSAYVSDLWVDPLHQRQGVGRSLLRRIEDDIFREGLDVSVLETHAENGGAIRFYAREGYGIVWRGVKFSRLLGRRIEKVRMEKQLVVVAH